MDSAKGDALEWALALLRAPAERHALRQKPLPGGMERLLGIAAGAMPNELADAAQAFGEPEARIREAARFYAREVLFFAQSDAYRVLGVDADSSDAQIKANHRLLQHWLHPDRLNNEDDAVFAARVNVAWNRLRNPERRQAYDDLLQGSSEDSSGSGDGVRAMRAWVPDLDSQPRGWRHRLPVLVLTASCILLVVLALRDQERGTETWSGGADAQADDPEASMAAVAVPAGIAMPAVAREQPEARPLEPRRALEPQPSTMEAMAAPVARVATAGDAAPVAPRIAADAIPHAAMAMSATPQPAKPATVPARPPAPRLDATAVARPAPEPVQPALPTSEAPARADPAALPSYERTRQAWDAGEQLLRFMAGAGRSSPPIWSSPAIQSSADRLRQDLHEAGRVRLADPQWQIGERNAVLTSAYAAQGVAAGAGRLTADLVWREGRWLVVGLGIERPQ